MLTAAQRLSAAMSRVEASAMELLATAENWQNTQPSDYILGERRQRLLRAARDYAAAVRTLALVRP